jgi:lactate dehydrogenase-like 2-hydroxyacid dehydrogenase
VPVEILTTGALHRTAEEKLPLHFTVHKLHEAPEPAAFLAEIGGRVRGAATGSADAALLDALPNLEIIANPGVGYDGVDVAACKARGIRVTNTPDVLNDAVAEITIGLMVALCRRLVAADRHVRDGRWAFGTYPLTAELTGKTVGIVGLGRIGKEIARRCQAMKMRVVYFGRHRQPHQPYAYYSELVDMARDCDWLVVIAPGGDDTRGLVSRPVLEALGPEGMLVNMARGSLVDEPAMVEMLAAGSLGGAALDVFANEPEVPPALIEMDNVVLSPHQGSATVETRDAMGDLVVANLLAHFEGRPLLTPVV